MLGGMSDRPLLISQIIEYAALYHGDVEIVSRSVIFFFCGPSLFYKRLYMKFYFFLLIDIYHLKKNFPKKTNFINQVEGPIHRYTYADSHRRSK